MKNKGFLLAIEGPDGCGKTYATKLVTDILRDVFGKKVITTREIGGTPIAEDIRKIVFSKRDDEVIDKFTRLMLFLAARNQHYKKVIKPAIDEGFIVVTDRYNASTTVLQGHLNHLYNELGELNRTSCLAHISKPADAHILLLGDPKTIYERGSRRKNLDNDTYKNGLESTEKITAAFKQVFNFTDCFDNVFTSANLDNSVNVAIDVTSFDNYELRLKKALELILHFI